MQNELNKTAALYFAQELRTARARALADAEGWQELIFVFERIAKSMTCCQMTTLGTQKATKAFRNILRSGRKNNAASERDLETLRQQVVDGRNAEFHGGVAARRFARHCVEFSFLLEDGLRIIMSKTIDSVMSSPVISVEPWQMLAEVRRAMLESSFTWIPLRDANIWRAISDHALVDFLNTDREALVSKTIKDALSGDGGRFAPSLKVFPANTRTDDKELLNSLAHGPVLVSAEPANPERIIGIVTAFDLL